MKLRNRAFLECAAVLIAAAGAGLVGCQGGATDPHDFISDNPKASSDSNNEDSEGNTGAGGFGAPSADDGAGNGADRAIAEADIIQIHEGKLYALSQYAGLSIIDISVPDQLTLLGRYSANQGTPFEMYLRDGVVYAMFNEWGQYIWNAADGSYSWETSSHIEALDVEDPSNIMQLGSFDLAGAVSDSRIVGDVLYAVSYQNGYCWGCENNQRNTTITSIRVGNPTAIAKVDELSFSDNDEWGYGWHRSVSATSERMYVAGIEWNGSGEGHSTIQVVDISDPQGDLVLGTTVQAKGQIENRWQMDEHDGVLRVISQPGMWWSGDVPAVQTFNIISSQNLQPLGYKDLVLPRPETLRSVRFDGERGYAITAEQTDPLFTIDLSDPTNPVQMGELEMPGWVHHMEPRGDRILALGFDQAQSGGSLHVSLFDVSDLSNPTMINRVAFGGDWSNFAEDQDRIHKAFTIIDQLGLILVPYSGWSYGDNEYGCGSYESGIQLVDFTQNSLTKRGVASSHGQARRAFVSDGRLFAVSDAEVRTFNIANRDTPQPVVSKALATISNQSVQVGNLVARLSADWWTSEARIDLVPAATPDRADPIGRVELSSVTQGGCYGYGLYNARLFGHGQHLYLVWPSDMGTSARILSVDVTDPANPVIGGETQVPLSQTDLWSYYEPIVQSGDMVVQAGNALVFRRSNAQSRNNYPYDYYDDYDLGGFNAPQLSPGWLEVVDLSNPGQPTHVATVALPEASGHSALRAEGTTVMLSHWVPLPDDDTKARFYLDRVNVGVPSIPISLPPVNVPGSLMSFDATTNRLLTVDYQRLTYTNIDYETCYRNHGWDSLFEPENRDQWTGKGTCIAIRRAFKVTEIENNLATLLDSHPIPDGTQLTGVVVGDDRVFSMANNYSWYNDSGYYGSDSKIFAVGGIRAGALQVAELATEEAGYMMPIAVDGKKLVASSWSPAGLWTLDSTDFDALSFEQAAEMRSSPDHVTISNHKALCSLGTYGLEVVDLGN
ncbi:beta-propeller domain-containing protein [Chondromyces crocatus]|uniref:Uncharacterized protein n=1 Tax=Chondromyces crocatus TaxID=52 RepID=A0A0K1EE23_CHOCO|nr:beta-propeller domain-containing protein [Chondromyces crocatus]AKT38947.1 uncharacterized protein CMC5_030940 [Chondromyces crocatus]